jgi:hypothetical protein
MDVGHRLGVAQDTTRKGLYLTAHHVCFDHASGTGAPCFDRAGDGPIPPAQQKFSVPGIKLEEVRTRSNNGAPLTPDAPLWW